MEIVIKKIYDFYPTMKQWAKDHDFILPPIQTMPYDVFVLKEDGVYTYCLGVFIADQAAITAFPLSNKKAKRTKKGLVLLHKAVEDYVKKLNIYILWTTTATDKVRKALIDCDWFRGDSCVDHYIKIIN